MPAHYVAKAYKCQDLHSILRRELAPCVGTGFPPVRFQPHYLWEFSIVFTEAPDNPRPARPSPSSTIKVIQRYGVRLLMHPDRSPD